MTGITRTRLLAWCLLAAAMLVPTIAVAQTQKGMVRTLGRPDRKSQGLGDVIITILGAPNSVKSAASGAFSFALPGKKEGDVYTIAHVRKTNYALVDKGINGRKFGYSSQAPLEIVMVSNQQLEADKQRIEERANDEALKRYNKQLKELEQLRQEKRLTEEDFSRKVALLGKDFEKFLSLIEKMAETYALTDYENISEVNRQICAAIENAELEKAQALILSKGDYEQRKKQAMLKLEVGEQQIAFGEQQIAAGEQKKREGGKDLDDLAQEDYFRHTICAAKYQNDSAAFFLERRAKIVPEKADRLLDAANFIAEYLADFEKAEHYARRALEVANATDGPDSEMAAYCLNDLANILEEKGALNQAMKLYKQSVSIRQKLFGEQSEKTAKCYSNIASVFEKGDMLDSAKVYFERSLQIRQALGQDACGGLAKSYVELGMLARREEKPLQALEYYSKALPLVLECDGEESGDMVELSSALGMAYQAVDSLDTALEWYERGLNIARKIYGEEHPYVATLLENIGTFFYELRYYKEAYDYRKQAMDMRLKLLGEYYPDVRHSYNNIALSLYSLKRKDEAFDYMQKTLQLDIMYDGENSNSVATDYTNMAGLLAEKGQKEEALRLNRKAIDIYTAVFGRQSSKGANTLNNMATVYQQMKDYEQAKECYQQAMDIYKAVNGERHSNLITVYNNMAEAYGEMGDQQKRLELMEQALDISRSVYGEESAKVATIYCNLCMAALDMKEYNKAVDYVEKAKANLMKAHGENSEEAAETGILLSKIYEKQGDYAKAIPPFMEYLQVAGTLHDNDSREMIGHSSSVYLLFVKLLAESPTEEHLALFQQFCADKSFAVIPRKDSPAARKGVKSMNVLLKYFDWTIDGDTTACFLNVQNKVRQLPKRFVVMDDEGKVKAYEFEDSDAGVDFVFKPIGLDRKQAAIKAWRQYNLDNK